MRPHSERRVETAKRHVAALRAFHTGLIAETHQHLYILGRMARHIDVLRQPNRQPKQKLAAAHASCREMTRLEGLKQPWGDTSRDFRRALHRVRALYREIVEGESRHRSS
jgi:hypothetical protein